VGTFWNHRFRVVLRPLRDRTGPQTTIFLDTRTAAQATREATIRHPEMKVVSVAREVEPVANLVPRIEARATASDADAPDGFVEAPTPIRRVGR
jgi:hypothetical protein